MSKTKSNKLFEEYKKGYKIPSSSSRLSWEEFEAIRDYDGTIKNPEERGKLSNYLNRAMNEAVENRDIHLATYVAKKYKLLDGGVRNSVKRKLKKVHRSEPEEAKPYVKSIQQLLQTPPPKHKLGLNLESRLNIIILFLIVLIAGELATFNLTGNAIGNFGKTYNALGISLLIFAILWFVLFRKK